MKQSGWLLAVLFLIIGASSGYAQWDPTGLRDKTVLTMQSAGPNLIAGVYRGGIETSLDNGDSWAHFLDSATISGIVKNGSTLFAGADTGDVWRSSDSGLTWKESGPKYLIPTTGDGTIIGAFGRFTYAVSSRGFFRSSDLGDTWINSSLDSNVSSRDFSCLASMGGKLFAGSSLGGKIYESDDSGKHWFADSVNAYFTQPISALATSDNALYAGTLTNGIFKSTNDGLSWHNINLGLPPTVFVSSLIINGQSLIAGVSNSTGGSGVFLTNDGGGKWRSFRTGLPITPNVQSLVIHAGKLYAGLGVGGTSLVSIWSRPLSSLAVDKFSAIEDGLVLSSNFPNPSSTETTISITTSRAEVLDLSIVDMKGTKCMQLTTGHIEIGEHSYHINASLLANGVYCCIARTQGGIATTQFVVQH